MSELALYLIVALVIIILIAKFVKKIIAKIISLTVFTIAAVYFVVHILPTLGI